MAHTLVIPNGESIVTNVIEAEPGFTMDGFTLVQSDVGGIGWTYANGAFTAPAATAPPSATTESISRRQFYQQLASTPDVHKTDGSMIITQQEAVAALSGTVPPPLETLINALPADEQFAAVMKIAGATQFLITDPVTQAIAQAYGWSQAQLGTFWNAASALQ